MEIIDHFEVSAPPDVVWQMFADVPNLVACLPGAELTEQLGDDVYRGEVRVRLGPMRPSFEGEARVERDESTMSGIVAAKGMDRKGGSRAEATVRYSIRAIPGGTRVELVSTIAMLGRLAQFGRTNLLRDISAQMTSDFAGCLSAKLAARTPQEAEAVRAHELRPVATAVALLRLRLRRAVRRRDE